MHECFRVFLQQTVQLKNRITHSHYTMCYYRNTCLKCCTDKLKMKNSRNSSPANKLPKQTNTETHTITNTVSQRFITTRFSRIYAATISQHVPALYLLFPFLIDDYEIESYSTPE